MNYDPRFTEVRDRCQRLALSVRKGQPPSADSIAQLADDLATVAVGLNSLFEVLDNKPREPPQPFKSFGSF